MAYINEPIAVVGIGCRFPGESTSPAKLWELLSQPRDLSIAIPSDRFNLNGFYHPDGSHHGTSNVQKSYFLSEDVRKFDAKFFNISTTEAESMDPQQRQLLEVVYEAMESANLTMEDMRGTSTAVYVGLMCDDYSGLIFADMDTLPIYGATGAARSILSNRVSYFFDWTGPSMTIDSACSSSLVAVHHAVQQLRTGECKVALAAGANLILSARMFVAESKLKMLSPNGHSRMWDAKGDGYARGEGIAAVMMKRLSDAIADGDHIECVIRETGVNQGGRSTGLTVPNPNAQVNLVRSTYAKAGLDLDRPEDRPQYFQAHGTGTKVGDLNEATAIHNIFFDKSQDLNKDRLFVGSIKTVIGHSEGAAGIAGMLEACLAVKNGMIPPNLHFDTLNPALEPFIRNLEVPTTLQPWPAHAGNVRRASINSFGFGGTNAHVILERAPEPENSLQIASIPVVILPFVFSAACEGSLTLMLSNYSRFLGANPTTDLHSLAWTLLCRRSVFPHKVSFSAQTASELRSKLDAEIQQRATGGGTSISSRLPTRAKRILGVFTGQGAQWPAMGWDLISSSSNAKTTLQKLEDILATLPVGHRPAWSLTAELSAPTSSSRVAEAVVSQPLCTAIQIILVDHLRASGINFAGVVGHSSGEIGAAYAAGYISADAAIKIAYYRGFYAKLAGAGVPGAMIAVGTSRDEAVDFCDRPEFRGRINVAASNSSSSVTLSGDADAITEAKLYFESRGVFARVLKVDTAYHSHHMASCSSQYLQALEDCSIEILPRPADACLWFSSVNEGCIMDAEESLTGVYWMENMLNTVLFSQALSSSVTTGTYDFAIEVGPHPALQGPALQTLQEATASKKNIPYASLLSRGKSGVETFAAALGSLWMHFGTKSFDAAAYERLFHDKTSHSPLQGLPSYPWDHERSLWYESRGSRATRLRPDPPHELLGITTSDQAEGEFRWRNYLKLSEIPWLSGHRIQGQTIFPAAGYLVMMLEASKSAARDEDFSLIEIRDFQIVQAITINDDDAGVEVVSQVTKTVTNEKRGVLSADFTCHACLNRDTGSLVLVSSGKLILHIGAPSEDILPSRSPAMINDLREVDTDAFYGALATVGYEYTGPFRGIAFLEQKLDLCTGIITESSSSTTESSMMMHPGTLDSAIQTLFACLGTPGDGSLWSLHVPVAIRSIRVNPATCAATTNQGPSQMKEFLFDAALADSGSDALCGDVTLYDIETQNAICQVEGIEVKPLTPATAADDRLLFHELVWSTAEPDAALVYRKSGFSGAEIQKAETLEMICLYYLKQLLDRTTAEEREETNWHGKRILDFAAHVVGETRAGRHASCRKEWLENTWQDIQVHADRYEKDVDCKILHVVGTKLIPFIRDESSILEHMRQGGLLDLYYQNSELMEYNRYAGLIAAQITFRYPLVKILEIGGGTGGVTRSILKHIDNHYSSYTFTDISVGFFKEAQEAFQGHGRILYEALDIEQDPVTQGFSNSSYDLVIASNVLHATKVLENTMANVRKLLKPGGKLLVLEAVDNGAARVGFSFCGVPGWWAGADDGRDLTPLLTTRQWDSLLLKTGFSGIDTVTPGTESVHQPVAVFVSTAVDDQIRKLQKPLAYVGLKPPVDHVVIVGGKSALTRQLGTDLKTLLGPWANHIETLETLEDVHTLNTSSMVHVVNLAELDSPMFANMTPGRLEAFKELLNISKSFLWVTAGSKSERPYSNMALGIGRTLVHEMPHLRLQVLDAAQAEELRASLLAEAFLRIIQAERWENDIHSPVRMWSNEPELWLEHGRLHITRVIPERAANDRLMSSRRLIEEEVATDEAIVEVVHTGHSYELQRRLPEDMSVATGELVSINVTHSTSTALRLTAAEPLFLILGEMTGTRIKLIALTRALASTVFTPASWTLPWSVRERDAVSMLMAIATEMMAQSIIDMTTTDSSLLVLDPEPLLAAAIDRKSRSNGIKPMFITSNPSYQACGMLKMSPFSSDKAIKSAVPTDVSIFVDLSDSHDLAERLRSILPPRVHRVNVSSLFSPTSNHLPSASLKKAADILSSSLANAMVPPLSTEPATSPVVVSARNLPRFTPLLGKLSVVDWTTSATLPARIQSAESLMRFKKDRTYLLIGMTGDLGRSLCKWMILHGAKHIVLTSRNPRIDQRWLEEMETLGGEVKVMTMDITSRESLLSTHQHIASSLPPIAGVANAAMVLSDTLLSNMSFQELSTVISPKVHGSRYLDELFPRADLDFFVLFGSAVDVMGNSGQSAYCAANMFMNSLVSSRRRRGLAGSLIGLGEVKGVGYAARMNRELNDIIGATLPLSEKEVHHMFAEGVLAGRPESGRDPILYAGMDSKDPRTDPDILWYPHPKFWHYIQSGDGAAATTTTTGEAASWKSQLAAATSMDDVLSTVTDAFSQKLRHKLQIPPETSLPPESILLELGIDSLVAVDLRAWFVTELGVDMPLLKILGGSSLADLVADAASRLPPTMLAATLADDAAAASVAVAVPNGLGGFRLEAPSTAPPTAEERATARAREDDGETKLPSVSASPGCSASYRAMSSRPQSPAASDLTSVLDPEPPAPLSKSGSDGARQKRKMDGEDGGDHAGRDSPARSKRSRGGL